MGVLVIIVLGLFLFTSVAAWLNTRTILSDLSEIKKELGNQKDRNS